MFFINGLTLFEAISVSGQETSGVRKKTCVCVPILTGPAPMIWPSPGRCGKVPGDLLLSRDLEA